ADCVVFEVACTVGLRPQADFPRYWWLQYRIVCRKQIRIRRSAIASRPRLAPKRVLQSESAIERRFEITALNRHPQLMPGVHVQHERLATVTELYRPANSIMKLPQCHIVFRVVVAHSQPVAVGFYIEEDSRAAVGIARDCLELHADRAVGEVVHASENG